MVKQRVYNVGFIGVLALLWVLLPSKILPSLWGILSSLPDMWFSEGFGQEMWTSVSLNLEAAALMITVSLAVAYSTQFPDPYGKMMRPVATAFAAGRFNSFVGLPFLLVLVIHNVHLIKVIILAIGMAVFSVQPIQDIIENVMKERLDDARTLRANEWRVVWEVRVLGTLDQVLDVLRTSSGMGWMMLPLVEGTFRSEGGVGVFLLQENKYLHLEYLYGAILVVALVGLGFDRLWLGIKKWIVPWSFLTKEQ